MKKMSISQIAVIGLMTAVICILGPLTIPIGPVPISTANLAILFAVYVLGMKRGVISCLIYLLIGMIGIPVFSAFSSGPGKLFGPTGGYMIGYVFMAAIAGVFIDRFAEKKLLIFAGMVLGTLVLYLFGTVWLAHQAGMSFQAALMAGVIPFVAGDLVKILIILFVGPQIRSRLNAAGLSPK